MVTVGVITIRVRLMIVVWVELSKTELLLV